ncbi:MAG: hypothetical protein ABL957_08620 [Parvularculaceae bacterium]
MKRLILVGILSLGASLGAVAPSLAASSVDKAIDAALACRTVADNAARLACFDGAVAGVDSAKAERSAELQEKKVAKEKKKREDFGLKGGDVVVMADTEENFGGEAVPEIRAAQDEKRLKTITATATSIKVNSIKQATLVLDNGQVWKQLESDDENLGHPKDGKPYTVTIKRATFGNYMATVEELNRTIRVTRVK